MKTMYLASILAVAAFAGCGSDPLVGTWGNSTAVPTNASSATLTLAFKSGGKITATGVTVFVKSASTDPGCTRTVVENGTYKETTSSSSVAISYTSGTSATTGCLNDGDDHDAEALGAEALANDNQTYTYTVSGNTLSLAVPGGSLSYTKQ